MSGGSHDKEHSPQLGASKHKRSVFGSSSSIFGHRPVPSQTSKSTTDIKTNTTKAKEDDSHNDSESIVSPVASLGANFHSRSEFKETSSTSNEKPRENLKASETKELSKEPKKPSGGHSTSTSATTSEMEFTTNPEEIAKESESNDASSKPKSSTSFTSYLSKVKKRKQEKVKDFKKEKEYFKLDEAPTEVKKSKEPNFDEDGSAKSVEARLEKYDTHPKTKTTEGNDPDSISVYAIEETNTSLENDKVLSNLEGTETQPKDSASNNKVQKSIETRVDKETKNQISPVDTNSAIISKKADESNTQKPDIENDEKDDASPPSTLSSELSVLPSSSSTEKPVIHRTIHVPSKISESDDSDEGDITRTPRKDRGELSIAEDSDAETVYGGTPPKVRRGRLVRKSDMNTNMSEKRIEFEENEDSDSYHKTSESSRLNRRSISKSSSPQRSNAKKTKKNRDSSGRLKLQIACDKGKYEQAKKLIEEGADINDQDYAGTSALHEAALKGHTDIVELLLKNGADVDIQSGPYDLDTPLIDAASNGNTSTVEMLLKFGADPRIQNAHGENALDSLDDLDDETPYIKSILREATLALKSEERTHSHNNSDIDDYSHDEDRPHPRNKSRGGTQLRGPRKDLLLVDFTTRVGREEVYSRASDGDVPFVGTFLENGGKPDTQALALAAKFGHTDVVNLFLAFGAKVDLADEKGLTPLMQTVGRGHLETVKLLLQAGADPMKRTNDNKSVLDIAMDSLISEEKEINLIKDALSKSGKSSQDLNQSRYFDVKTKKRKISVKDELESHDIKKKKTHRDHQNASSGPSYEEKEKERGRRREREKAKERQQREIEYEKEREREKARSEKEKDRPKLQEVIAKPTESKFSAVKSEPLKRTHSGSPYTETSDQKPPMKVVKVETEEEKQVRLIKEKEESKKREELLASKAAKRKAREQEFLNNFETEEKKKEEELKKLAQEQAERKLQEAKDNEERIKREEERKMVMSQKEETEKRRQIRERYPYGLQIATFDANRSKEEVLTYLPLYSIDKEGVKYFTDLQVILLLGIEKFYEKYSKLIHLKKIVEDKEKPMLFNYFYPFLGNFTFNSTSKQLENYKEELNKFNSLVINWINYDDVLTIIKEDFESIYDVVATRTLEIDSTDRKPNSEFTAPSKLESGSGSRKISSSIPTSLVGSSNKKIPLILKNRPSVMKVLSKNKTLW